MRRRKTLACEVERKLVTPVKKCISEVRKVYTKIFLCVGYRLIGAWLMK